MIFTATRTIAVLGLLKLATFVRVWRTNRRLDAVAEELRAELAANRRELDEKSRALNRRVGEVAEDMRERIGAANRRLDERWCVVGTPKGRRGGLGGQSGGSLV